ncbi:hypothetical protein ACFSTD_20455 [Novosphingobium colocasiae]
MNSGTTAEAKGQQGRSGATAGVMLFACVGLLALPSAVLAFGNSFQPDARRNTPIDNLGAEAEKPRRSRGQSCQPHRQRALAVHARRHARPLGPLGHRCGARRSQRGALDHRARQGDRGAGRKRTGAAAHIADGIQPRGRARVPELCAGPASFGRARFRRSAQSQDLQPGPPGATPTESRFSPRISFDEKRAAGRSPRTFSGDGSEVDLGGAYRVTENLDVTAGVRYSQDRERLVPLNDGKQQDSQAVYVGTQFRF